MTTKAGMGGRERRKHARYEHELRITLRPLGQHDGPGQPAELADVSRTGIALLCDANWQRGSVLVASLEGMAGRFERPVMLRVANARKRRDGRRQLGCYFVVPLGEEEMQALLLVGSRAS